MQNWLWQLLLAETCHQQNKIETTLLPILGKLDQKSILFFPFTLNLSVHYEAITGATLLAKDATPTKSLAQALLCLRQDAQSVTSAVFLHWCHLSCYSFKVVIYVVFLIDFSGSCSCFATF